MAQKPETPPDLKERFKQIKIEYPIIFDYAFSKILELRNAQYHLETSKQEIFAELIESLPVLQAQCKIGEAYPPSQPLEKGEAARIVKEHATYLSSKVFSKFKDIMYYSHEEAYHLGVLIEINESLMKASSERNPSGIDQAGFVREVAEKVITADFIDAAIGGVTKGEELLSHVQGNTSKFPHSQYDEEQYFGPTAKDIPDNFLPEGRELWSVLKDLVGELKAAHARSPEQATPVATPSQGPSDDGKAKNGPAAAPNTNRRLGTGAGPSVQAANAFGTAGLVAQTLLGAVVLYLSPVNRPFLDLMAWTNSKTKGANMSALRWVSLLCAVGFVMVYIAGFASNLYQSSPPMQVVAHDFVQQAVASETVSNVLNTVDTVGQATSDALSSVANVAGNAAENVANGLNNIYGGVLSLFGGQPSYPSESAPPKVSDSPKAPPKASDPPKAPPKVPVTPQTNSFEERVLNASASAFGGTVTWSAELVLKTAESMFLKFVENAPDGPLQAANSLLEDPKMIASLTNMREVYMHICAENRTDHNFVIESAATRQLAGKSPGDVFLALSVGGDQTFVLTDENMTTIAGMASIGELALGIPPQWLPVTTRMAIRYTQDVPVVWPIFTTLGNSALFLCTYILFAYKSSERVRRINMSQISPRTRFEQFATFTKTFARTFLASDSRTWAEYSRSFATFPVEEILHSSAKVLGSFFVTNLMAAAVFQATAHLSPDPTLLTDLPIIEQQKIVLGLMLKILDYYIVCADGSAQSAFSVFNQALVVIPGGATSLAAFKLMFRAATLLVYFREPIFVNLRYYGYLTGGTLIRKVPNPSAEPDTVGATNCTGWIVKFQSENGGQEFFIDGESVETIEQFYDEYANIINYSGFLGDFMVRSFRLADTSPSEFPWKKLADLADSTKEVAVPVVSWDKSLNEQKVKMNVAVTQVLQK